MPKNLYFFRSNRWPSMPWHRKQDPSFLATMAKKSSVRYGKIILQDWKNFEQENKLSSSRLRLTSSWKIHMCKVVSFQVQGFLSVFLALLDYIKGSKKLKCLIKCDQWWPTTHAHFKVMLYLGFTFGKHFTFGFTFVHN